MNATGGPPRRTAPTSRCCLPRNRFEEPHPCRRCRRGSRRNSCSRSCRRRRSTGRRPSQAAQRAGARGSTIAYRKRSTLTAASGSLWLPLQHVNAARRGATIPIRFERHHGSPDRRKESGAPDPGGERLSSKSRAGVPSGARTECEPRCSSSTWRRVSTSRPSPRGTSTFRR